MTIRFIVWDGDGSPSYLASLESLARWAQVHYPPVVAFEVGAGTVERRQLIRIDDTWQLVDERCEVVDSTHADISTNPRVLRIVDYVETEMTAVVSPVRVAKENWQTTDPADPLGTYSRFGHLPPTIEEGQWRWRYCPDLIAAQTRHLSDEELNGYLCHLDIRVGMCTVHRDLAPVDLERAIEEACYNTGPQMNTLVNETQMRVLDSTTG